MSTGTYLQPQRLSVRLSDDTGRWRFKEEREKRGNSGIAGHATVKQGFCSLDTEMLSVGFVHIVQTSQMYTAALHDLLWGKQMRIWPLSAQPINPLFRGSFDQNAQKVQ